MGSFPVRPGALEALRERYYAECAPVVRASRGSVDCYILEPVEASAPAVVCTVWQEEADAVAYEQSGSAAEVVGRVREFFAAAPALQSYRIHRT